jgi:2-keto-3-deoxy-L-rhamnonate aldolase RhmA
VYLGGLATTGDLASGMIERGYRLILTGFDTMLLQRGAADILAAIRK